MDPGQAPRKKRSTLSGKTKPRISRRALKAPLSFHHVQSKKIVLKDKKFLSTIY